MTIFIELTDLVVNTLWHGVCSGIQRVQINTAMVLIKNENGIAFSVFDGKWVVLNDLLIQADGDPDLIMKAICLHFSGTCEAKRRFDRNHISAFAFRTYRRAMRLWRDSAATEAALKNIIPGDTLVILGAFWQMPSLVSMYRTLESKGVSLIGICHDIFSLIEDGKVQPHPSQQMKDYLSLRMQIITVSEYTKNEILNAVSIGLISKPTKTPIVVRLAHEFRGYERIGSSRLPEAIVQEIADQPYVLMVGGADRRKNHSFAIQAWGELYRELGFQLPILLCVGKIESLRFSYSGFSRAVWYEMPSDSDLASFYRNSLFSIFPSTVEGWGLPVGESLWFGKCCIATSSSSLPEVGGDLCLYFSKGNLSEFKAHVKRALEPGFRGALEQKIMLAKLRKWDEVFFDLAWTISSLSKEVT